MNLGTQISSQYSTNLIKLSNWTSKSTAIGRIYFDDEIKSWFSLLFKNGISTFHLVGLKFATDIQLFYCVERLGKDVAVKTTFFFALLRSTSINNSPQELARLTNQYPGKYYLHLRLL
jgi:hypothetical protein